MCVIKKKQSRCTDHSIENCLKCLEKLLRLGKFSTTLKNCDEKFESYAQLDKKKKYLIAKRTNFQR